MKRNYVFVLWMIIFFAGSCKDTAVKSKVEESNSKQSLTEDALLDFVEKQTLKYFWDYAEPHSGMARERFHPDGNYPQNDAHIVTMGGSGFGIMSIIAGIDRGYILREKGLERLERIANFLKTADRYHGAWPHWLDGETGKTKNFGEKDNGGDLVETAFLSQGLICVREYLKNGSSREKDLAAQYDELWKGIEWNWYTNGKDVLYWHWSPTHEWEMNFPLEGYNECLIAYVMAAASPTHTIAPTVYKGWTRNGAIKSDQVTYGVPLLVKHNGAEKYGGPLFWAHYSYLGLDPHGLKDQAINYWDLNHNQVKIDYLYCIENPKKFKGYGADYWGLTASYTRSKDGSIGYTAHAPGDNDTGVISPTAAVSSIVYLPNESMAAIRNFYENYPELWGPAGFYDAHSVHYDNWVAKQYLAIDQGPMVVMIENYRSGLLWELFMNAPEIQSGLKKIGFTSKYF